MEKAKREIERLKAKLISTKDLQLSPEAKRLLQLYAQGWHDWTAPEYRKGPWQHYFREALKEFGNELKEGLTPKTLYLLLLMTQFRGEKDNKKAKENPYEAYLLARKAFPKAMEELFSKSEEDKTLLKILDKTLSKPDFGMV